MMVFLGKGGSCRVCCIFLALAGINSMVVVVVVTRVILGFSMTGGVVLMDEDDTVVEVE